MVIITINSKWFFSSTVFIYYSFKNHFELILLCKLVIKIGIYFFEILK